MIKRQRDGVLTIDKLEAMTSVCSVGLDMIAIPGDTPVETIAGIIADENGNRNDKQKDHSCKDYPCSRENRGAEG